MFTYDQDPPNSAAAEALKELDKLKAEAKKLAKANATAAKAAEHQSLLALQDKSSGKGKKICFHFRDHGSCPKGKDCPYSHDKELRKQALADRSNAGGSASYAASSGAGSKRGGKGKAKAKAKAKASPKGSGKGTGMVHSLPVAPSAGALPSTWTLPLGASMANPFAAAREFPWRRTTT